MTPFGIGLILGARHPRAGFAKGAGRAAALPNFERFNYKLPYLVLSDLPHLKVAALPTF